MATKKLRKKQKTNRWNNRQKVCKQFSAEIINAHFQWVVKQKRTRLRNEITGSNEWKQWCAVLRGIGVAKPVKYAKLLSNTSNKVPSKYKWTKERINYILSFSKEDIMTDSMRQKQKDISAVKIFIFCSFFIYI